MIRFFALLALTVMITVMSASGAMAQSSGRKFALVIGNANYLYVGNQLTNPVNDSKAMAAQLRTFGYKVTEKEDLGRADMVGEINAFIDQLAKDDVVVIYYAGHGIEYRGRNYLVPTDAKIESEGQIEGYSVDFGQQILDKLAERQTNNIIIIDACRESPFTFRRRGNGLAAIDPSPGTLVLMSAAKDQEAFDAGGGANNSIFTSALLNAMRKPGVDIDGAFGAAAYEVSSRSDRRQTPTRFGNLLIPPFPLDGGGRAVITPPTYAALPPQQPVYTPPPAQPVYVAPAPQPVAPVYVPPVQVAVAPPAPVYTPPAPVYTPPPPAPAAEPPVQTRSALPPQMSAQPPASAPIYQPPSYQAPTPTAPAPAPQQMASLPSSTAPYAPSGGDGAAAMASTGSSMPRPVLPPPPVFKPLPSISALGFPQRFCSQGEANAFNTQILLPLQADARANSDAALAYQRTMNAMWSQYRRENSVFVPLLVTEAKRWEEIAKSMTAVTQQFVDQFDVLMSIPTDNCGRREQTTFPMPRAQAVIVPPSQPVQIQAQAEAPPPAPAPAPAPVQLASVAPMRQAPIAAPQPIQVAPAPEPVAPAVAKPVPVAPAPAPVAPAPAPVAAAPVPAPAPKPTSTLPPVTTQSSAPGKWAEPPPTSAAPVAPRPVQVATAPPPVQVQPTPAAPVKAATAPESPPAPRPTPAPVVAAPSATPIKPPAPVPVPPAAAVKKPEPAPAQMVSAPTAPAVSAPRPSSGKWAEPPTAGTAPKPVQTAALTPPATAPTAPRPVAVAPPAPKPVPPVVAKPAPAPPVQTAAPAPAPKPAPVAPAPASGPTAATVKLALALPPPTTPVAPPPSLAAEPPAAVKPGKGKPAVAAAPPARPAASPAVRDIETGRALAARGDFTNALAAFERAVAAEPSNADALVGRGYVRMLTNDDTGAQADFNKALTLRANFAEGFYFLGQLYKKKGLATAAIQQFDKALAVDVQYARAYVAKGETLEGLGRIPEAFAAYDMAVKSDPGLIGAYIARGRGYFLQADYNRAWDDFQAAIDKDPFSEDSFYGRGRAELALKRFNEAISTFEELAGRRPDYGVQCSRGMAYLERGLANRDKKDRSDFQKAYDSFGEAILLRAGDTTEATNRQSYAKALAFNKMAGIAAGFASSLVGAQKPSLATLDAARACASAS